MTSYKVQKRNLPHQNYKLVIVSEGDCVCQNCDRKLKQFVEITNENNQSYLVGTKCAESLLSLKENSIKDHIKTAKNTYKKLLDCVLKKGCFYVSQSSKVFLQIRDHKNHIKSNMSFTIQEWNTYISPLIGFKKDMIGKNIHHGNLMSFKTK